MGNCEFVSRCVLGVGRQPKKEDASASGATAAEKRNMERMRQMSEQVLYLRGENVFCLFCSRLLKRVK